jgi:hypothetical protein
LAEISCEAEAFMASEPEYIKGATIIEKDTAPIIKFAELVIVASCGSAETWNYEGVSVPLIQGLQGVPIHRKSLLDGRTYLKESACPMDPVPETLWR